MHRKQYVEFFPSFISLEFFFKFKNTCEKILEKMIRFEDQHRKSFSSSILPQSPAVAHSPMPSMVNSGNANGSSNKIPNFLTASIQTPNQHLQPPSPSYFGSNQNQPPMIAKTPSFPMSPSGFGNISQAKSPGVMFAAQTPGQQNNNNNGDLSALFHRKQHSASGLMTPGGAQSFLGDTTNHMPPQSPGVSFYVAPEKMEAENWVVVENFVDDVRSLITERLRKCGDIVKTDFSLTTNRIFVRFAAQNQARACITMFGQNSDDALFTVRPMDDMKFIESLMSSDGAFDYKKISPVFGSSNIGADEIPKQLRFRRALSVSDEIGMSANELKLQQNQILNGANNGKGTTLRNQKGNESSSSDSLLDRFLLWWYGLSDQGLFLTGSEVLPQINSETRTFNPQINAGGVNVAGISRCRGRNQELHFVSNDSLFFCTTFAALFLVFWLFLL